MLSTVIAINHLTPVLSSTTLGMCREGRASTTCSWDNTLHCLALRSVTWGAQARTGDRELQGEGSRPGAALLTSEALPHARAAAASVATRAAQVSVISVCTLRSSSEESARAGVFAGMFQWLFIGSWIERKPPYP